MTTFGNSSLTFNRTRVECKYIIGGWLNEMFWTFNRTRVECKYI